MQNDKLMCDVIGLAYAFDERAGKLWMGEENCCDMKACVALFQAIDPDVDHILTVWTAPNGKEVTDTRYYKDAGRWFAVDPDAPTATEWILSKNEGDETDITEQQAKQAIDSLLSSGDIRIEEYEDSRGNTCRRFARGART